MGIARVGAAGSRGVELSVGADGEGTGLSLPAGTRPCAAPGTRLDTFTGLPEVFVTQLCLAGLQGCGQQWVTFGCGCIRKGGGRAWWIVLLAVSWWPGLLLMSSVGAVTSRASIPVLLMVLTDSRRGSIPKCGCILPLLRDMV